MNGGSHPYASLDGGAWNPSRGSPNPVATLDARIKSLGISLTKGENEKTGEVGKDQTTLLIILGFLFPMVAAMIVQGDINKLYN